MSASYYSLSFTAIPLQVLRDREDSLEGDFGVVMVVDEGVSDYIE